MVAMLPLARTHGKTHDGDVFDVYCSGHGARILLSADDIVSLVNRPGGIELHWRCGCGQVGVRQLARPQRARQL